ncbi:hypothetical protein HPB50_029643 [Hyalomma asiaticum]|nr:hypothetical protein HPB50_029643 [Hyalomma asiaticum]
MRLLAVCGLECALSSKMCLHASTTGIFECKEFEGFRARNLADFDYRGTHQACWCFHHAGFSIQEVLPDEEDNIAEEADILFRQVTQSTSFTREDYETLDANVATCREDILEELIAEVQDEDPCSSGDEMVCDPGPISVPDSAARDAVILLQRYFEHNGGTEFLPSLSAMHSYFVRKCLNKAKQTVITSFFPSQQY